MAYSITIQVGKIEGESVGVGPATKLTGAKPHAGEIDVLSWNWGIVQTASAHSGSGGGTGTADVKDLTITKFVDKATPTLLSECFKGNAQAAKEKGVGAVLTVFKVTGDDALEFVVIKLMGTVLISSVNTGTPMPNDRYGETVTLNFSKATFEYKLQAADNTAGAPNLKEFNIA
jgi:type VI secretion system secreted protein Hcp